MKVKRSMKKVISTIVVFAMVFVSLTNGLAKNARAEISSEELAVTYLSATVKYLNFGEAIIYDFNIKKELQENNAVYFWYVKEDKGDKGVVTINGKTGVVTAKEAGTAYIRCKITLADGTILRPEAKVIVRNNITEVDISNIPEKETITAGEPMDFNRAVLNTDAGKGKKSKGITRWEIDKDSAGVTKITESGVVTPVKKGSFSVRAICFQSKAKYDLWRKDKETNKKYITAASKWYTVSVVDAKGVATIATQVELDKALASKDITQITISTEEEVKFTIAAGDYLNKTLIVDAPNADVDNYAKFKNIIIRAIKENTWNENANGNTFQVTSIKVRIIVNGNAEIREIIFDRQNSVINLEIEGTVHQITILQPSELNMSGDGNQVPITIEKTGDGSRITTSIPVNLECDENSEIVLNPGAEGTTINKSDSTVEIMVENNSDQSVIITTDNLGGETIEAGESGVSNGTTLLTPTPSPTPVPPSGGGSPAAPTLNSIVIKAPATKTVYLVGETLNISGLVIEGTYSNANKSDVAVTAANVTGFNSTAVAASQTLTVAVSGKTVYYTVEIKPITLSAINSIIGTAKVDVKLTAGSLTPAGATVNYQWKICNTFDGSYTNIDLATTNIYTPVSADEGKFIIVVATGTGNYKGTVTSAETLAVTATDIVIAKRAAHIALTNELGTYTQSNYTLANWTTLTGFKTAGDTAIDEATEVTGVTSAQSTATSGMVGVKTIAQTLAEAKTAAHGVLATALGTYIEANYTLANWTTLTGFKTAGDTAIDAATEVTGVTSAQSTATSGMVGVKTIAQTLTQALADAITAANLNKTTAIVSSDGTDVLPANKWVTSTVMTTYINAIAAAQSTVDSATTSQAILEGAVTALEEATTAFNGAKQDGIKVDFISVTNSTTANDEATLGIVGTIVSSSDTTVATAVINLEKIDITSVSPGTATITVTDASTHNVTIAVTVAANGSITIGAITFLVASAADLDAIRNKLGFNYKQVTDITLSGSWTPIGNIVNKFSGNYNGNGYKITNLTVMGLSYLGLFSSVSGRIENVILENVSIVGTNTVIGGLAGQLDHATITNCRVSGTITGPDYTGGLVGYNYLGNIQNCSATGNVNGIGESYKESVGGLVGINKGSIVSSYAAVTVTGSAICSGGLVGTNAGGSIDKCYATGDVTISESAYRVGGLVGSNTPFNGAMSTITESYATGKVSGNSSGGLVGLNEGDFGDGLIIGTIQKSYYDQDTTCQYDTKGSPRTTDLMMKEETFIDWDWAATWSIDEGLGYPVFK